jgi:hypothetical protein
MMETIRLRELDIGFALLVAPLACRKIRRTWLATSTGSHSVAVGSRKAAIGMRACFQGLQEEKGCTACPR